MSDSTATGVRQRSSPLEDKKGQEAPASLSSDPNKKVPRNKPHVSPPFANMTMNAFLRNLFLVLVAILAFYIWRITVWASDAGGYWPLLTGNPNVAAAGREKAEAEAGASLTNSLYSQQAKETGRASTQIPGSGTGGNDIQSSIIHLAGLLGCSPSDLTTAIRPFIDPTVANPLDEAKKIREEVEKHGAEVKESTGPGLLGILEEIVLD